MNALGRKKDPRSGQAMLIAVLSLGGAILGATAVAGILTLYQLRASNDTENSAKSLFAADSAVEWTLFDYYCGIETPARCSGAVAMPTFPASGATAQSTCYDASGNTSNCNDSANTVSAVTVGVSSNVRRAFVLTLTSATSATP